MKWQIFNFGTKELVPVWFDTHVEATKACGPRDKQCVVLVGTGDSEERGYMEKDEIWCDHTLHPLDCLYCNPEYVDAFQNHCPGCKAWTWHVWSDKSTQLRRCVRCSNHHQLNRPMRTQVNYQDWHTVMDVAKVYGLQWEFVHWYKKARRAGATIEDAIWDAACEWDIGGPETPTNEEPF